MISRVGSHLLFCEPDRILKEIVVERDEHQTITSIFSLTDAKVETEQTLFFDGIISLEVVSLMKNLTELQLVEIRKEYNYVDFTVENAEINLGTEKPLVIDFGTEKSEEINRTLLQVSHICAEISLFDFIAACVYFPALILRRTAVLELTKPAKLILWEQVDLLNKKLKTNTQLRVI